MIADLQRFVASEQPYWIELETLLGDIENHPERRLGLDEAQRFHYLYRRASSGLVRLASLPYQPRMHQYLEPLVARAFAEIYGARERQDRFSPWRWFTATFPHTFRRHGRAFTCSLAITLLASLFGGLLLYAVPESKELMLPFSHLQGDPRDRVAREESTTEDRMAGHKGSFAASLMSHNTKVSITAMALGMTWGVGTVLILFQNGLLLGAVTTDYALAGQTKFLVGWLLPHGAVEIPSILIAGQAGLVLGWALIGWGSSHGVRTRLRLIRNDLVTLIGGVAVLLVWAGIVESFFSQYHEPVLPYSVKIAFGVVELCALFAFLIMAGRTKAALPAPSGEADHG